MTRPLRAVGLEPLGLSVTETAKRLGVTRFSLSRVVKGHAAISPAMALRLEAAGGGVAEGRLRVQLTHDLGKAKQQFAEATKVKPFPQRAPEPA